MPIQEESDTFLQQRVSRKATIERRDEGQSVGYVWYVILLLTVVNVVNYMDRMALSVLMPFIKSDLGLSDGQLGFIVGFAFFLFYAVCGVPIAWWADRGIRRNIIALALAIWSLMTVLSGAAQNYWHLFAARVGVGVGEAGCLPPAQSILCDYVPMERRPGVFAVHSFGLIAGMMIGMGLSGWLGETIGWRWTFVVLGIPGVVLALVVRWTLHEPARGHFDVVKQSEPRSSFGTTVNVLWRCATYRLLMYYLIANGFVQFGLNQWWPSFYARVHTLGSLDIGVHLGIAIGIGSGSGMLLGGFIANLAARRHVTRPLIVGIVAVLLSLPTALISLFITSARFSMLLVAVTGLLWGVASGPIVATVYSVTKPAMRATAGAITIFCTSVLGFGLGPFCVGMLSDVMTPSFGNEALRYALLVPIALIPIMAIPLYWATRTLPNDLNAAAAGPEPGFGSASSIGIALAE
jgi:predicted MFS family arabinose efflux permease